MLTFVGLKRVWAWFAGGLLVIAGLFLLAHPAFAAPSATTGEIQGGKYVVEVEGTKITAEGDNTKVTISPDPGGVNISVSGGKVVLSNVKPGTYTIKLDFKFTSEGCKKNWFTSIINKTPLLSAFCSKTDLGDTYYSATKTYANVVVTNNTITYLDGSDASTERVLGTANQVGKDGTPVIDCSGKGIIMTWIVCPTLEVLFGALDFIFEHLIKPFLSVNPLTVTDASGQETILYTVWNNVRNIANIAFILVFFVIIFSQATSAGITNYGIKRLLPRLIIVAVATNLSFFICAILVDIFNVLGAGAASLVISTVLNGQPSIDLSAISTANLFANGGMALGIAALAPGIIFGVFVFFIFALIVVLIAAATLIVRQVFLIFLFIVAPLAFVAGLLPNTQSLFRKWGEMFIRLLAMYPIIVLLFAAGKIASSVLSQVGSVAGESAGVSDFVIALISFMAFLLPLLAIPFAFKLAGGAMHQVYSKAQDYRNRTGQFAKKRAVNSKAGQALKGGWEQYRQKRFLEGKGVQARLLRGGSRFLPKGARGAITEQTLSAAEKLRESQLGTTATAIGRLGGSPLSAHLSRMNAGESIDDYIKRAEVENGGASKVRHKDASGNPAYGFSQEQRKEMESLQSRFGTRIGTADFRMSALMAAHASGSDYDQVMEATRATAEALREEKGSVFAANNVMIETVAKSAKANGFQGLGYAGLDPAGKFSPVAIKLGGKPATTATETAAARSVIGSITIEAMEKGQLGEYKDPSDPNKVSGLGFLGKALLEDAGDPSIRDLTATKIGQALRNPKIKHRDELLFVVEEAEKIAPGFRAEVDRIRSRG